MNRDEIASKQKTVAVRRSGGGEMGRSGARHVARLELGQTWPSYLTAALLALFIGLTALSLLRSDLESVGGEDLSATLLTDSFFLVMLANLGINWTSPRWAYVHRDPFALRLSFLRALPISTRGLILGRAMVMLAATAFMSLVFFLPAYALFPALRAEIPAPQYLWFALFWIGYVLFSGGVLLYLELGVKGKATLVVLLVWTGLLVAVVLLALVLEVPLAQGSLDLVGSYGPLAAIPALAVGGGCLFLWCRLLERRLRTRELPS